MIETQTPRQIVAELDQYIVGQTEAKRAVAVALRNRFRRLQLPREAREDILPKNILMIGSTGVGKTEIARRLAQMARAPFIKVEATKFTEVGYVGRDVDSMIRDLASVAVRLVEQERSAGVVEQARERALDRVTDQVWGELGHDLHGLAEMDEAALRDHYAKRDDLRAEIASGKHGDVEVYVEFEEPGANFLQVFGQQGVEELNLEGLPGMMSQSRTSYRRLPVREAIPALIENEAKLLVDRASIHQEALQRAEQSGIIFIDELDKVAIKSGGGSGPEVSREGVQRDLLPVIEGATVQTKFGPLRTDHILFICAGAFHMAKPSDLIPELQGRLPIRVELHALNEEDFGRILREPKNALIRQYQQLLGVDGVSIDFTAEALDELAHYAVELNSKVENIGARRLHTLMENLLADLLFAAPDCGPKTVTFDVERVRAILGPLVSDAVKGQRLL